MSKILLLTPTHTENLHLTPTLDGNTLVVHLKGNADSAANDAFGSFVVKLHEEAQRLAVTEVRLNLTELYFMTSSCIKCFVTWVGFIKAMVPARRYTINFVVNPNLRWQKRNLDVLLQLTDLMTLTEAS